MTTCLAPTRPERDGDAPLEAVLVGLHGLPGSLHPLPGLPPIASPTHRATAREQLCLASDGEEPMALAKRVRPELRGWICSVRSLAAQRHAATLGVAPKILAADPGRHVHVEHWIAAPWRPATLADLSVLGAVLAAKRKLDLGGPLRPASVVCDAPRTSDEDLVEPGPWLRITALAAALRTAGVGVALDLDWLLRQAEAAASAVRALPQEYTLCHGECGAGNVFVGSDDAVRLVDYDLAGNADPWLDLTSTLLETCEFDEEGAAALERLEGRADRGYLARLRLYGSGPLTLTKTVFDMIDEQVSQVAELGSWRPRELPWMAALAASGLDLVPCMNDALAGSFMIGAGDAIRIVDFEYASNNERAYELALWFGEMFFTEEVERELIEVYCGRWTTGFSARVRVLRAMADLKWATWARVQELLSTLDFDFRKYGLWKYQRARGLLHHPDWPLWLRWL